MTIKYALSSAWAMRAASVRRWHIVRVAREQTIAEHMYLVWLLVTDLCERMNIDILTTSAAQQWALIHDLPEIEIGDMPTPTKFLLRHIHKKQMGTQHPWEDIIDAMEETVSARVNALVEEITDHYPIAFDIVTLMDAAEAIRFMHVERMDAHGDQVLKYVQGHFDKKMMTLEKNKESEHALGAGRIYPWFHARDILEEITRRPA